MLKQMLFGERSTRIEDMMVDLDVLALSQEMRDYGTLHSLSRNLDNVATETGVKLIAHRLRQHGLPVNFTPEGFNANDRYAAKRHISLAMEELDAQQRKTATTLEGKAKNAPTHIERAKEKFNRAFYVNHEQVKNGMDDKHHHRVAYKNFLLTPEVWELYERLAKLTLKGLERKTAEQLLALDKELFDTDLYKKVLSVWWDETKVHEITEKEVTEFAEHARDLDETFFTHMGYQRWDAVFEKIEDEQKLALFQLVFKIKKTHEKMLSTVATAIYGVYPDYK